MNVLGVIIFLLLIIVVLIASLISLENSIESSKLELEDYKSKLDELQDDYEYYYGLASSLWEHYRSYDLFPSRLSREISKY